MKLLLLRSHLLQTTPFRHYSRPTRLMRLADGAAVRRSVQKRWCASGSVYASAAARGLMRWREVSGGGGVQMRLRSPMSDASGRRRRRTTEQHVRAISGMRRQPTMRAPLRLRRATFWCRRHAIRHASTPMKRHHAHHVMLYAPTGDLRDDAIFSSAILLSAAVLASSGARYTAQLMIRQPCRALRDARLRCLMFVYRQQARCSRTASPCFHAFFGCSAEKIHDRNISPYYARTPHAPTGADSAESARPRRACSARGAFPQRSRSNAEIFAHHHHHHRVTSAFRDKTFFDVHLRFFLMRKQCASADVHCPSAESRRAATLLMRQVAG